MLTHIFFFLTKRKYKQKNNISRENWNWSHSCHTSSARTQALTFLYWLKRAARPDRETLTDMREVSINSSNSSYLFPFFLERNGISGFHLNSLILSSSLLELTNLTWCLCQKYLVKCISGRVLGGVQMFLCTITVFLCVAYVIMISDTFPLNTKPQCLWLMHQPFRQRLSARAAPLKGG